MTTVSELADEPVEHDRVGQATGAKWAALVDDRLIPLPRRKLPVRVVLAQANLDGTTLARDYNVESDITLRPDDVIDLADGNVFRVVENCESTHDIPPPGALPKLAYFADDAWEVSIAPEQSLQGLKDLFGLPADAVVFRDMESPQDVEIRPNERVRFADGPVFKTKIRSITVKVNRKPVQFDKRRQTGLSIKQAAIAQGVAIELRFVLYRMKREGGLGPVINDNDPVVLHECDEFRCVLPDDNS